MKVYEIFYLVYEVWYMKVYLVSCKPCRPELFPALHPVIIVFLQKRIYQRISPSDIPLSLSVLAGYLLLCPFIQRNILQTVEHHRPLEVFRFPLPAINGFYPSYEISLRSICEFITLKKLPHDKPMSNTHFPILVFH